MLIAAGFASQEPQANQRAEELFCASLDGLRGLISIQDPIPVVLLDGLWNITDKNSGYDRLLSRFGFSDESEQSIRFQGAPNLLKLFYFTAGMCDHVGNGSAIGRSAFAKLNQQASQQNQQSPLKALVNEILLLGETPKEWWEYSEDTPSPIGVL